jgi:hypothetical protein
VEKPVREIEIHEVEKIVHVSVEKPTLVEVIKEVPVEVTRYVEVEKIVERPVVTERIV